MSKYILIGGGGLSKEVQTYIKKDTFLGVLDDDDNLKSKLKEKYLGSLKNIHKYTEYDFLLCIGDVDKRNELIKYFENSINKSFTSLIHEKAFVDQSSKIDNGTIICPNVFIGPNTKIGANCLINNNTFIAHDCVIGNNNVFGPKVCINGNVQIGDGNIFGATTMIERDIKIGSLNKVMSGVNLLNNLADKKLAMPSKTIITNI